MFKTSIKKEIIFNILKHLNNKTKVKAFKDRLETKTKDNFY